MAARAVPIAFTVGSRRLFAVSRTLCPLAFSLEDALAKRMPPLPRDEGEASEGIRVLSAPAELVPDIVAAHPGYLVGGMECYHRHFIAMHGDYEGYLARFSSKTRSTLRRKERRFARETGGTLDIREYRSPEEIATFLTHALPLSAATYQARFLDAGLPADEQARAAMVEAAGADRMRCFLLWAAGRPVAYLSLPVDGETLVYAHLGYHPDWARLSPGTVLQMGALERLFAERRFRYFDFTEGDGAHKALFGTDSVACRSFLLLRRNAANRVLMGSLAAFDTGVAAAKTVADRSGVLAPVRRMLRA